MADNQTNGWDARPADWPPPKETVTICDHCGQVIEGEVHPDHERWCDKPDTGCDCAINACAGCCEWCAREDFPTAAEWLVDKMTMEHPTAGRAILSACWVLKIARSGSLPGLRAIWTEIVTRADILVEIEAALADAGCSLDTVNFKELRGHWMDAATDLYNAGELDLFAPPPALVALEEPPPAEATPWPWPTAWQPTESFEGVDVFMF